MAPKKQPPAAEWLRADELRPWGKNPRRNDETVAPLMASIEQLGFGAPLVARRMSDGSLEVVAGHTRLRAAQKLFEKHGNAWVARGCPAPGLVPVRVLDHLSDEEARALAVADNRIGEISTWDETALADILGELGDLPTGFSPEDLADLLSGGAQDQFRTKRVAIDDLKPHPKNYRQHPADQLAQVVRSIEQHGFYRNVVVARDNTILAGHGVVLAARQMGRKRVPVIRLDLDPSEPRALKVLVSDNEISHLAESDDRALTEMLKSLLESGDDLMGTGFTGEQLAALTFVTRPASELREHGDAAEWVGLPEYEMQARPYKVIVSCSNEADYVALMEHLGQEKPKLARNKERLSKTFACWWPAREREDPGSVKYDDRPKSEAAE